MDSHPILAFSLWDIWEPGCHFSLICYLPSHQATELSVYIGQFTWDAIVLFILLTFICVYGVQVPVYWCTWGALHLISLTQDLFTDLDLARQSTSPSDPCFLCHSTGFIHTSNHSFLCRLWGFELRSLHLHSKYLYHLPSLVFWGSFETRVFLCSLDIFELVKIFLHLPPQCWNDSMCAILGFIQISFVCL